MPSGLSGSDEQENRLTACPAARVYDGLFADSTSTPPEYEAVLNRAYGCLRAAKALHDETESRYIPRMDFSALVDVESRVYREMDALAREVDGGASSPRHCHPLEKG